MIYIKNFIYHGFQQKIYILGQEVIYNRICVGNGGHYEMIYIIGVGYTRHKIQILKQYLGTLIFLPKSFTNKKKPRKYKKYKVRNFRPFLTKS